jgi:hypothetical protein
MYCRGPLYITLEPPQCVILTAIQSHWEPLAAHPHHQQLTNEATASVLSQPAACPALACACSCFIIHQHKTCCRAPNHHKVAQWLEAHHTLCHNHHDKFNFNVTMWHSATVAAM